MAHIGNPALSKTNPPTNSFVKSTKECGTHLTHQITKSDKPYGWKISAYYIQHMVSIYTQYEFIHNRCATYNDVELDQLDLDLWIQVQEYLQFLVDLTNHNKHDLTPVVLSSLNGLYKKANSMFVFAFDKDVIDKMMLHRLGHNPG